jgi:preprotein translocase subunit SecG
MYLALAIIHLIMCFVLILVVLLQTGKGAQMGSAFGSGGSQTIFGARGTATFLSKLTTIAAIVFMLTSLSLAMISSRRGASSIIREEPTKAPQTQTTTPPAGSVPTSPTQSSPPPQR